MDCPQAPAAAVAHAVVGPDTNPPLVKASARDTT